ncbi:VOC family protein [Sphingobacterium rhinopitheci]|uniref:VOC family protein n=1 Tax=Sphingobacterium rhinopitheci TaxID=2781960 RepID=UPI001F529D8F|nr:VOC family protein [Sphingobacterium rhinopitheci]MCI0922587.1 glyoxalase/bleomycin resistance/extradiol dioxygenase family protein [Sphingobacterium rhinopitheci]
MKVKSIYITLAAKDLNKTKDFWTRLGFLFNEENSSDKSLCLVLNEGAMYSMFIRQDYFNAFTNRMISDDSSGQMLIAIEVESKERLEEIVNLAILNGGTRYKESMHCDSLCYDSFADPDGHKWEIMYANGV